MVAVALLSALTLAFPNEGQSLPFVEQSYAIGSVKKGETNVVINGRSYPVYRTGAWAASFEVVEGENTLEIVSQSGETMTRRFTVGARPKQVTSVDGPKAEKTYEKLEYAGDEARRHPAGRLRRSVTIALDPGHGGSDTGALSPHGHAEKEANLLLARAVRDKLTNLGYRVVMTRDDDSFPALYDRPKVAFAEDADAFVSIHHNAPPYDRDPRQMRYHAVYSWNPIGEALAKSINSAMSEALGEDLKSNGAIHANYAVTRNPEIPSCLIEADFITSPEGEEAIWNGKRRLFMAEAIAKGIDAWCNPREGACWPFITVRQTCGPAFAPEKFEEVIAINARHPGSCDEYWFAHCAGLVFEDAEREMSVWKRFIPICEKAGITVGFQQGITLGHGGDPRAGGAFFPESRMYPYTEDAWAVTRDGSRTNTLCPRSPEVLDYEEKYVALICRTLAPESIWLDDDLRLGCYKDDACFCDRCLAAFRERTGHDGLTREELVTRLYGDAPTDPIRKEWVDFNADQLATYGAAARRGADSVDPTCRLALQTVSANDFITGDDYRPVLEALAGGKGRRVGVRAGSGFYGEEHPREMLEKMLAVTRECERCRTYGGLVAQVSYEEENYYREVLHKSVGAILIESTIALASGCDALTLYWWDYMRDEPLSYYEEFASGVAAWRPYLERVAKVNAFTHLGGIANDLPDDLIERGGNYSRYSPVDFNLSTVGIPVTVEEAKPVWMYNADQVELNFTFPAYPTTSELEAFRDLIDEKSGGKVPVRVGKTHMMRVFPRTDDEGRLHAVTCWNLSMGPAKGIPIRLRNPASSRWVWARPCEEDIELETKPGELPGELVVTIPDMAGYSVGTLFPMESR